LKAGHAERHHKFEISLMSKTMKLGKCPICSKDLHYYVSLEIDDWKRYDLDCKTQGCLINDLEWNYEDKDKLVKTYKTSIKLANDQIVKNRLKPIGVKKETSKPVVYQKSVKVIGKKPVVHYSKSAMVDGVKCSSWKTAKEATKVKSKVTCSRCLKMLSKSKLIRTGDIV
jgi:hypothetical protein